MAGRQRRKKTPATVGGRYKGRRTKSRAVFRQVPLPVIGASRVKGPGPKRGGMTGDKAGLKPGIYTRQERKSDSVDDVDAEGDEQVNREVFHAVGAEAGDVFRREAGMRKAGGRNCMGMGSLKWGLMRQQGE